MWQIIRQFRPFYTLYNLFQWKSLKHISAQYQLRAIPKWYFSPIKNVDFATIPAQESPWLDAQDSADILPQSPIFKSFDKQLQAELLPWSKDGYVILKGFFSEEEVDKMNQEIDNLIEKNAANWRYDKKKIMFAIRQSAYLKTISEHPKLIQILELLLGKNVFPFQSINFLYGSEQKTHSDSVHMTTFPLGFMIAAWVALEDINTENGPLHYYPGSHKLPYFMNNDYTHGSTKWWINPLHYQRYEQALAQIIASKRLEKHSFLAKKGDILIWHANLLHGGNAHNDKNQTRKSMVLHYFAKEVICYHEISERPALIEAE